MSYSFMIPKCSPDEALLKRAGARFSKLGAKDATGWIAWRGSSSRGVFVYEDDGNTQVKLPTLASQDDVALAQELAAGLGRANSMPVDAEEPPDGVEHSDDDAPPSPEGYEGIFLFRPEEIEKWSCDWHDAGQSQAGFNLVCITARKGGAVLLSGPHRRSFVGQRMIDVAFGKGQPSRGILSKLARRSKAEDIDELTAVRNLIKALAAAQDVAGDLPLRPRFMSDSLKLPKRAGWSPSPFGSLIPAFAMQGDITQLMPQKRTEAHHTVALPDSKYLLPMSDYVAVQETNAAWACIPFDVFVEALGARFIWVDEFVGVVDAPSKKEWETLVTPLCVSAAPRIKHQAEFMKSSQELAQEAG